MPLERSAAAGDPVDPRLGGACSQRNTRPLVADSGDLGSESIQLDLRLEVLTVPSHRVGRAAVARKPAESIRDTDEPVVEGGLGRAEEELGHAPPVSLTSGPAATDGQSAADSGLLGSTRPATAIQSRHARRALVRAVKQE